MYTCVISYFTVIYASASAGCCLIWHMVLFAHVCEQQQVWTATSTPRQELSIMSFSSLISFRKLTATLRSAQRLPTSKPPTPRQGGRLPSLLRQPHGKVHASHHYFALGSAHTSRHEWTAATHQLEICYGAAPSQCPTTKQSQVASTSSPSPPSILSVSRARIPPLVRVPRG